jgi:uncharacterized membrane-anchored protein
MASEGSTSLVVVRLRSLILDWKPLARLYKPELQTGARLLLFTILPLILIKTLAGD